MNTYKENDISGKIGDRFLHLYGNILPDTYIKNNNFKMTTTQKRYLISSLVTFLTGFAGVILMDIDKITLTSFSDGAVVGIVFTAIRAGVKAVLEYLLAK